MVANFSPDATAGGRGTGTVPHSQQIARAGRRIGNERLIERQLRQRALARVIDLGSELRVDCLVGYGFDARRRSPRAITMATRGSRDWRRAHDCIRPPGRAPDRRPDVATRAEIHGCPLPSALLVICAAFGYALWGDRGAAFYLLSGKSMPELQHIIDSGCEGSSVGRAADADGRHPSADGHRCQATPGRKPPPHKGIGSGRRRM